MEPSGVIEQRKRLKKTVVKTVAAIAVLAVAGAVFAGRLDVRALIDRGVDVLRSGGPWLFFLAMALLPAVGVPLLTFMLTAGPAFGAQMGMGAVVAAGLAAITVNFTLTYWLARRELRPWLIRLVNRLGYQVPEVEGGDMTDLIVVVRVTPGIPFPVQNYLLGLAGAPPAKYFGISCAASWLTSAAFIIFGDALLHGKGKRILIAASLIVVCAAAAQVLRRHYAGRALRLDARAKS